ncbi:MAG: AAA family ATPase, partial [Armatimonadota bacterium]
MPVGTNAGERNIRVLVCDDAPEVRTEAARILDTSSGVKVLGLAENGLQCLEMAKSLRPDVVLMDVAMPVMNGFQATELIKMELPEVEVVLMSTDGSQEYLRRAMISGARDFLVKPFAEDELVLAVRRACLRRPAGERIAHIERPLEPSEVFAVCGARDGAGKTTVAVNIAAVLAGVFRFRVALADMSFRFGEVGLFMGLQPRYTVADLRECAGEVDQSAVERCMVEHGSGVRVLCAPAEFGKLSDKDAPLVEPVVRVLRQGHRYVILDTAPELDEVTQAAMECADSVLLVVLPEQPSVKRALSLVNSLRERRYPLERVQLVVNRAHKRSAFSAEQIAAALDIPLLGEIPSDGWVVVPAVSKGVPFVLSNPESRAVHSIRELAAKLVKERRAVSKQRGVREFLSRLEEKKAEVKRVQ